MVNAKVSWAQAVGRRMRRHALDRPAQHGQPAAVAEAMCGAHAQVLSAAELSLALRLEGATRREVRAALWTDRSLVKTLGPRGTVHLLPADDLPMWTGALSAVPATSPFPAGVRLSAAETDQVVEAIGTALAETELTIDELTGAVVERAGAWAGERVMPAFQDLWPRWRQATTTAAHRGVLCFGPNRGRNITYTNPHRWRPRFVPEPAETALDGVVRRYLRAYGPATPQQFAQWFGAPPGWAVKLFDSLRATLYPVDFEGQLAWLAEPPAGDDVDSVQGLRLLPYFDAYTVGGQPRARLFPGPASQRALVPSGQAGNYPVLLVDGEVAGVWHQRRAGRTIHLTVEPLTPLNARRRRDLDDQAARVADILEATPTLTLGPVTVGPHA